MARIRLTASFGQIDVEAVNADLRRQVNECFVHAARCYLRAAVPLVPVFTGFARSVLAPVEDLVGGMTQLGGGRSSFSRKSGGVTKARNLQPGRTFYYYPTGGGRVVRTNTGGRQFSTATLSQFSPSAARDVIGVVTPGSSGGRNQMTFTFEHTVNYFDNPATNTAWGATEAGEQAFRAEFARRFARVKPRLKTTRVNITT